MASLTEHGGAVNRLALSQDQAFFVSASSDGTCKARLALIGDGRGDDAILPCKMRKACCCLLCCLLCGSYDSRYHRGCSCLPLSL